jgi:hypothetical protein
MVDVSLDEARDLAYHYGSVHLNARARPVSFNRLPANGHGEPLWQVDLADREDGQILGKLLIGQHSGSTYEFRPQVPARPEARRA